jgi:hypothetical protein
MSHQVVEAALADGQILGGVMAIYQQALLWWYRRAPH